MTDDVKRYWFTGDRQRWELGGAGPLIVPDEIYVLASDHAAIQQQLADRQHELDSLNICEACSPSDAANDKCPLCLAKFMREKDDAAFRQTIGDLEQQVEQLQGELVECKGRMLTPVTVYTANAIWSAGHDESTKFVLEMCYRAMEHRAEQAEARVKWLERGRRFIDPHVPINNDVSGKHKHGYWEWLAEEPKP